MSYATTSTAPLTDHEIRGDALVRAWLWVVAAFVFAMVVVGGATRLTESGLSITEWKLVTGVIPPLTEAEWLAEFEKYRQIPEYQQINKGMSLDDFQFIYWWEWAHRLLGRVIGFVFLIPFLVFLARGYIRREMVAPIGVLFVLGGVQGAIGWWMVSSGLVERTDVSQYRLAVHLTVACLIFASTVWFAEGLAPARRTKSEEVAIDLGARVLVALLLLQIFLGGLVAGLDAGFVHNTWPLMDGALVPDGLLFASPWWINFFENHTTVQFVHRTMAYAITALALWHAVTAHRRAMDPATGRRAAVLAGAVLVQGAIGVLTLVLVVPLGLALAHQAWAVVLLAIAVVHARRLHDGRAAGEPAIRRYRR